MRLQDSLVTRLAAPGLALALLLGAMPLRGCGTYSPPGVYGYRVRDDEVRFTFRPRRYRWTTFAATGDSLPLRDLRVRRVSVDLVFQDGSHDRFALDADEGGFQRRVRRQTFLGRELLGFSFIVNDRFIAEPPREATNRIEPPYAGEPIRLRLDLPATP